MVNKINLTSIVLDITKKIKPFLVKFIPIKVLRRVKKEMINAEMARLKPHEKKQTFSRNSNPDGINLIGYIQGEIGLGQSCRLVAQTLEALGDIPFTVYNYEQISAMRFNDKTWSHKITNTTPYNINIIHINPYEMPLAFIHLGKQVWNKRYNIAFWLWELENFPPEWEKAFQLVDEVWTPSEFASRSIRKATNKPVHTIPYSFSVPDCGGCTREDFGLPNDKILFLLMYDCNSTIERKNPLGAIKAYKQAFSIYDEHVGIVIKVNNHQKQDIRRIEEELDRYPNSFIITDILDKIQVNGLIACADVYVSLHRAEGFGLVPAEAMLLGTPVIATNWSANTEFMNNEMACMVDYTLIPIEQDCGPYKAGNRWANPNIGQAAEYMRKLSVDECFRLALSTRAKEYMEKIFAPELRAMMIKNRLTDIYGD